MSQTVRTAFVGHSGADSGAEQSVVAALARWSEPGSEAILLLAEDGPIQERARAAGVTCLTVELGGRALGTRRGERRAHRLIGAFVALARHSARVRRVLEDQSIDVVVAFSLKALVFGGLAGRRAGSTVVWSLHDRVDPDYFPRLLVPLLRHVIPRLVDGIVVNSRATLATVRPGRTPVLVATPPIEMDDRPFHPPGDEVRRVVVLGRLAPWKGQDLFLRSFASAFATGPAEAYVVGGPLFGEDEYAESLRELATTLGIADRVHFLGHVQDPWAWLVDADILVHCSRIPEPFGMVVVQGLWARCAVVATRPGGPEEVITDGVDGLLVPCGDGEAMTGALVRLRDDHGLRRRLADAGRETARRYAAEHVTPAMAEWIAAIHRGSLPRRSVTAIDEVSTGRSSRRP